MAEPIEKPEADYQVGYGKPPVHSRFQKGRSGNPTGRWGTPTQRAKEILLQEAYRHLTVRDGGRTTTMPALQAVVRSQIALAAKGNGPAQRSVIRGVAAAEHQRHEQDKEVLKTAIDYTEFARRQQQRRKARSLPPDPTLPHPQDVSLDIQTGSIALNHEDFATPEAKRKLQDE